MLGRKNRDQLELFVSGSLEQLVQEDHVLARVDRVLDLGWLHEELADCYCPDNGRPGIDPEVAVRLMRRYLLPFFTEMPACQSPHSGSQTKLTGTADDPWSRQQHSVFDSGSSICRRLLGAVLPVLTPCGNNASRTVECNKWSSGPHRREKH